MLNIIILILIILILPFALASLSLAPWVPTRGRDLKRILELAGLKQGEIFYDLGCGNGKTVFYVAENSGAEAIGVELAYPLYLYCRIKQLFFKKKNIKFKLKSLFMENLEQANAVYIFGMEDKMKNKLKEKMERELKKGARVLTYAFPIQGWEPAEVSKPSPKDVSIYLYIKK